MRFKIASTKRIPIVDGMVNLFIFYYKALRTMFVKHLKFCVCHHAYAKILSQAWTLFWNISLYSNRYVLSDTNDPTNQQPHLDVIHIFPCFNAHGLIIFIDNWIVHQSFDTYNVYPSINFMQICWVRINSGLFKITGRVFEVI